MGYAHSWSDDALSGLVRITKGKFKQTGLLAMSLKKASPTSYKFLFFNSPTA